VIELPIQRLREDAVVPARAYPGDAGLDLTACERVELGPGERALVGTGLAIAIPDGYAGFVQPRSGLALRHGVTCLNTPGLIDAGYRDEISVLLVNLDPTTTFAVARGDRIAQLVIQRVEDVEWEAVDSLDDSARGTGGWGSTGTR
jgi:dUTP pyrophosphatase